jgi:predicted sulfurtransferase/predicted O-methyltransferase YrrM
MMMTMMAGSFRSVKAFSSTTANRLAVVGRRRTASTLITTRLNNSMGSSNQELVERRLEKSRAKRAARQRSVQERVDRNLHIQRLLTTQAANQQNDNNNEEFVVPPLYAVKVWVDDALRDELRLSGREKRGRVFIEAETDGVSTMKGLKSELFGFFRALRKDTFLLTASLPQVADDGTILTTELPTGSSQSWTIATDEDVTKTFQRANSFFKEQIITSSTPLKRPSIQINVLKDPNAPPPPPPPAYLEGMPDPSATETMTMLSFYAFPPQGIEDPEAFAFDLRKKWKPFQALGRVYVAQEGVNAQMSLPTNVLDNFMNCCRSVPELGEYMENDINIDPKPLTLEEFAVAGVPINGKPAAPFRNLHVRVRTQVVADGLDKSLDWQSAGYDCPPLEWHDKLKEARELREAGKEAAAPIILDCRNDYETDIGIFDGAEPLNTQSFRESWDILKDRLADTPKDAPIMTYCTGGIRCVKVGAYLTQELGFTNVSRLAGGIIAYDRTLNEKTKDEESMFKGTNFVFDGRLGRQITDDALASCISCGAETSLVSNCLNDNCHKRMVQCESCRTSFHGTCSDACRNRVVNGGMVPRRNIDTTKADANNKESHKYSSLDDYSMGHSSPVPSAYKEMELNTQSYLPSGSHMVSGAAQGRMLTQLTSMTREGRVLELGTFVGYATACFLEGARNVGEVTGASAGNLNAGPYVMTMERDGRAFNLAVAHMQAVAEQGMGEAGAEAVCGLRDSIPEVKEDLVSLSMDGIAGCDLVRVTDALATVEAIAAGKNGDLQPAPFDLVFVDADKTRLLEYVEACLNSEKLLKRGGLIVVDNVLWKGLVLEASAGNFASMLETGETEQDELRKNRRARKLANQMHQFNSAIVKDDRVEVMMLPMRDGLSVIRKK